MRFMTSRTNSHVFLVVPKNPTTTYRYQTSSNLTKPFNTVKMLCKPSSNFSNGRTFSGPVVIERPAISAMGYATFSRFGVLQQKSGQSSPRKSCSGGYGDIRKYSTAASVVTSSLGSLVFRPPSSLVVTSHLTQSNAPQKSEEWFALRRDKLTTSTFSTALGFWKGNRRNELWQEKVYAPEGDSFSAAAKSAMNWGVLNENAAVERYKSITGRDVSFLGFAVHADEKFQWLGASPDGLLGGCPGGGILEVKCPYNKGKPELGLPWSTVPFYYMPQVQGQMEVLDREWADLYCWTPNGSTVFRVCRVREYWELINGILREFWWDNVVPARELMSLGREEDARTYKPTSTHKQTGLAIVKSMQLAGEAKLLCKEIAGHVEFYS
ncbi:hypothetical protein AQUCO_01100301v1 [Aquilegia coerulea]|uniref:YqaJ viral recombinase domain-containing protein n=1 Tax=Aquilegia coerulea TaxID=218851 RepID=A0A2G5E6J7_AQUCA|nr:hypothetical protein AQUCO_01100301v1 [Aquilegia coerulea]